MRFGVVGVCFVVVVVLLCCFCEGKPSRNAKPGSNTKKCPAEDTADGERAAQVALELFNSKEYDLSEACYLEAIKRTKSKKSKDTFYHNLGGLYLTINNNKKAAQQFRIALDINPNYESAAIYLATALANLEDIRAAMKAINTAIRINPNSVEALILKSNIARRERDFDTAISALEESVAAAQRQKPKEDELEAFKKQVADRLTEIGHEAGDRAKASKALDMALSLSPEYFPALWEYAQLKRAEMKLDEAASALLKGLGVLKKEHSCEAEAMLGAIYRAQGKGRLAIGAYSRALGVEPNHTAALIGLVSTRNDICDWNNADGKKEALHKKILQVVDKADVTADEVNVLQPFYPLEIDVGPRFAQKVAQKVALLGQNPDVPRLKAQLGFKLTPFAGRSTIQIGYLMRCWEDTLFYLTHRIFGSHSSRFNVHMFWLDPKMNQPWVAIVDEHVPKSRQIDITEKSDAEAALSINQMGIHVLVDMGGYHNRERTRVLSWNAAPHQVLLGLGWPGTAGSKSNIDALFADRLVTPPEYSRYYDEKLVLMPYSYQSNHYSQYFPSQVDTTIANIPSKREAARKNIGLADASVVFGNCNSLSKLDPATFDHWVSIVNRVNSSKLFLLRRPAEAQPFLTQRAVKMGLSEPDIVFVDPIFPTNAYLSQAPALMDIFLDTRVYNAHTVATDMLYGGVPIITYPGEKFVSRVAASHLINAGLGHLIAKTGDDFVEIAVNAAKHLDRQKYLASNSKNSPLFDFTLWMKGYEAALSASLDIRLDESATYIAKIPHNIIMTQNQN